ncbi:Uncharacterized conserved protein, contains tandem ACT domains [Mariniphaga anaerophila]|uniref:Uncharacterized conserved protein, contains tandem ACT domains n=1 Tax=Mariniphaga anaerophila TaxID=1484053 RepID=A0A1M4WPR3_9BACT|nr:hypothetical protein [Mariniphaga anaerophila]SHE83226.1 Uncharacterized conserved protein, contains tandem ACT domains [Mariniphaga anaerophila]
MAYQVSVFLENKIGHFERVTGILKDVGVNIRAITLSHTTQGWGILNLLVNNPEKAKEALTEKGVSATLREIAVFAMGDIPGGLDELLKKIAAAGINFTNAYGRNIEIGVMAYLAVDVEDIEGAEEKIKAAGLQLVPDDEVYGLKDS